VQTQFVSQEQHKPVLPPYPYYEGSNADEACQLSLLRSLENLKTSYVDAFLVNAPNITVAPMLSLLNILLLVKKRGLARFTGLSNVATVEILEHLHKAVPEAIQIVQNPLHSSWDPEYKVHRYCRKNGIQYNTFHTLTVSDRIVDHDIMRSIASSNGVTPKVAFLQYCVQSDIVPLVGARRALHLQADFPIATGETQPLSRDQMRAVSRLMAEQTIINQYRAAAQLERARKLARKQKGTEKMRVDQEQKLLKVYAATEAEEQKIVEMAKETIKELTEKELALEEQQRKVVRDLQIGQVGRGDYKPATSR
jgi:diketogulonate reductase-like aldo/keto reductase